jgi:leader peptidase (prepilin peptidase) / N-methyltransferase
MGFLIIGLILFVIGVVVGSFLNVIVDRTQKKEGFIFGRSHCEYCKKDLSLFDLIPVFSYLSLKGKCRYCKKKLSIYYPLVEVVTGVLFALSATRVIPIIIIDSVTFLSVLSIIILLYIISVLVIVVFADIKFGIIPFWPVFSGIVAAVVFHITFPYSGYSLVNYLLSAAGAFAGFLLIFLVTRGRGIGFGDVFYVIFMGILVGYPLILLGLYIAFVSGAAVSLILIALKRKRLRGDSIAFGPFLVVGTVACLLWGDFILSELSKYLLM